MNRIICDICGTEYPEGYDRCPTCSYPRQGGEKIVDAGAVQTANSKVKGGRFSEKNVKKRLKAEEKAALAAAQSAALRADKQSNPNRPLWITIILLLLAIALVSGYIAMRFVRGFGFVLPAQTAATTTAPTETSVPPTVPCAGITLDTAVIALDEAGQQLQIAMKVIPEDTTDVLTFQSADPAIAEVSENGLLTAVGSGQTTVTITCGQIVRECTVVCWFPEETTAPTAPPETTAATEPPEETEPRAAESAELKLDQSDVSCFERNQSFSLYAKLGEESIGRSKITWSTSDDKVATVEKGKVVAVGKGTATITAEYQGKKATCIVRCRFEDATWKPSDTDVTLGLGHSFRLTVTNDSGETADAIWTMSVDGVVSIKGKTVTGKAPGTVTLTTTVDSVTMSCIVRVK